MSFIKQSILRTGTIVKIVGPVYRSHKHELKQSEKSFEEDVASIYTAVLSNDGFIFYWISIKGQSGSSWLVRADGIEIVEL